MDALEAIELSHRARFSTAPVSPAARAAVEVLIADITDRRGLKWEWAKIEPDIVERIKDVWGRIIDMARGAPPARPGSTQTTRFGCSQCGNLDFERYTAHAADRMYHAEKFDLFVE